VRTADAASDAPRCTSQLALPIGTLLDEQSS